MESLDEDKGGISSSQISDDSNEKKPSAEVSVTPSAPEMDTDDGTRRSTIIFHVFLAVLLVITGSANTIAAKWANTICISIRGVYFDHPFFQATVMFVGEICCMIAYLVALLIQRYRYKRRHANDSNQYHNHNTSCVSVSVSSSSSSSSSVSDTTNQEMISTNPMPSAKEKRASEMSEFSACSSSSCCDTTTNINNDDNGSSTSTMPTLPKFNWLLFVAPAFCDVIATSVQYVGLVLTSASSYQMLRGAVIICTGLLSMLLLRVRLAAYRWAGMICVVIGLVVVGVADFTDTGNANDTTNTTTATNTTSCSAKGTQDTHNTAIIGDILVIIAQVVVALQMVVEQKLLTGCDVPPLFAVGLEGIFGFIILSILMIPMYFIHVPPTFSNSPQYRLEDALDAFQDMHESGELVGALCLTVVSIAFFNFAGVSVTKYMSATTRMVLDSIRTIIIWAVSLPLFHTKFLPLQILGFVFLVMGMFIYNDLIFMPFIRKTRLYARIFPEEAAKLANKEDAS